MREQAQNDPDIKHMIYFLDFYAFSSGGDARPTVSQGQQTATTRVRTRCTTRLGRGHRPARTARRGKANRTIRRVAAMVVVVPRVPFHLRRPARRPPYCSCLACAPLSFLSRRWHGGRLLSLPSPPPHPPLGSFPTPPDNRRARPKGGACTGACRASHDALACCQPLARPRTPGTSLSPRPLGCPPRRSAT